MAVTHDTRVKRMAMGDLLSEQKRIQKEIELRQESNQEILSILKNIVDNEPDMRFCQILSVLGFGDDRFNEESVTTLKKIKEILQNL